MSAIDKDREKTDVPAVSPSSVPPTSSSTYTNGSCVEPPAKTNVAAPSPAGDKDTSSADAKERPPSLLKLVIPIRDPAREGLTSVSSSSVPSSSSVNSSPDSVSTSHSCSGLSDSSTPPHNLDPLDKKRTYSAHELHTWDTHGGPPSFNRSVTANSVDRKHSLPSTGPPPSFGLVSTSLQVEIQSVTLPPDGVKEVEDDKSTHTVFTLEVRLVSGLRWVIEKRYSDFRDFHDRMKKANATVRNLAFPKKHYFRGKTQSVIEQRRLDLEKYLKDILNVQPLMKMPIFNFLAVYAHLESYDRKKRRQQKEVDMKRMKNLLAPDELADVQVAFQRLCTSKAQMTHPNPTSNISSPKGAAVSTASPAVPPPSCLSGALVDDGGRGLVVHTFVCDDVSSSNNMISKAAFRRDVLSVFPDMPSTFAIRFMKGFSDKTSNDISVDEFLRAVAILRHGSTEDQLVFLFNMCDHDHLGKLQSTGLSNLLVSLHGRPVIDKPEYKRLVNELFDYGRTRLTADDFVHAMLSQPLDHVGLVLDWMPPFMQILCETASPTLLELQEDYNPVVQQKIIEKETSFNASDIAMLQDAFMAYRSSAVDSVGASSSCIDLELLAADFPLQFSDARLVTAFASFGPRANGVDIDIFSFVHALHIACRGTAEDKTKFGFCVFSTANRMTRDDLFAMLQLEVVLHSPLEQHIHTYFETDAEHGTSTVVSSAQIGLYVDLLLSTIGHDGNSCWTFDHFTKWATSRQFQIAALDLMKRAVFVDLGVIPANKKEEVEVAKLCYQKYDPSALVEGENWYIVEPVWFEHWRRYVEFIPALDLHTNPSPKAPPPPPSAVPKSSPAKLTSSPPSPDKKKESGGAFSNLIKAAKPKPDNGPRTTDTPKPQTTPPALATILDTDNNVVRPKYIGNISLLKDKVFSPTDDMVAGKHFAIVCEPLWRALKSWYGGGPEIKQTVVVLANGRATLDLWRSEQRAMNDNAADKTGFDKPVEAADALAMAVTASKYKRVRAGGSVGLLNLCNTCYMNSALQCIANTPLFIDYFLSGMYMDDINRTSTLGMQGKLAEAFGKLSEDMWSTKFKNISPREFKKTIGKFNEAFRGTDQQDAQELIAFLLSGLSEDLNRIHDKPYISQPDSDGRYDSDLADEWWRNHLKREVSIVVALFTGQYKSLLTCSACGFKSARFEPFTFLQVPLPEPTHNNVTIPVVFAGSRMPQKLSLRLSIDATIVDLKMQLVDVCMTDFGLQHLTVSDIKICEFAGSQIVGFKADNRKLGQIRSIDRLIAFQLEPLAPRIADATRFRRPSLAPYETSSPNKDGPVDDAPRTEDPLTPHMLVEVQSKGEWVPGTILTVDNVNFVCAVQLRHGDVDENVPQHRVKARAARLLYCPVISRKLGYSPLYFKNPFRPMPFGTPDLVRVCPEMTTGAELYAMVWERVHRFLKRSTAVSGLAVRPHNVSGPVQHIDELFCHQDGPARGIPFLLRRVETKGITDSRTPWLVRSFGWTIPCNQDFVDLLDDESIAIDWDVKVLQEEVDVDKMKAVDVHPSVAKNDGLDHGPVPLSHCLDAFSLEEKIPETYCSSCRGHQEMTKKLEIWRLPPVMVVQLKRFQYTQTYRRKLGTLVQFPVHGLDLASCVAPFEEFPVKYPDKKPAETAENKPTHDEHPVKEPASATTVAALASSPAPNMNRVRRGYTNTNLEQARCLETHYDLYGVVNHQGALGGGHYTAYAKNSMDGNWYCYDDERVRLIEESKVVSASAYLCFYVRKDMADITVDAVYPPKKDGKITEEDIDRFVEESDKGKCALM
ncbi:hypothetical protein H310_10934 [Aphanomyces invadans]|uniref:ubiquitinyl hydrolase 1 n=1 Tax=Aphanomyces invadans TaxID=157072 RepID=A0A024TQM3_9STRA|nr:hypothetical protein H310_10934 [Aphanomyces invadans]ETV95896.1 hypothetical protein H310_10934 [Aphanomyces invadans]|eukprot:XP_008875647.1 hypothetical protein H310_10934 [Aphanomyces invadans]